MNRSHAFVGSVLAAGLAVFAAGCTASLEGTYASETGVATLVIKGGEKADMKLMGGTLNCTYVRKSDKLTLACPALDPVVFTIKGDTLEPPDGNMIGPMKKK